MSNYEYEFLRKSLFWPILLIGVGVVFLLQNLGIVDEVNLRVLIRLWPLLIIIAGLNILFNRVQWVGSLLGALLAIVAITFLVMAPQMNLTSLAPGNAQPLVTENFSEAIDGAETLDLHLDMDYGQLTVDELEDSNDLMTIEISHRDEFEWNVRGTDDRKITARLEVLDFFNPEAWFSVDEVIATVFLAPEVPLLIDIDQGSGTIAADLSAFELLGFEADTGAGTLLIDLPAGEYPIDISSGAGTLDLNVAEGAVIDLTADIGAGRIEIDLADGVSGTMNFDIGSGSAILTVPDNVGVQIYGDTGVGNINVPNGYNHVSGSNNSGIWESDNFDDAELQLIIHFDLGAGQVTIND